MIRRAFYSIFFVLAAAQVSNGAEPLHYTSGNRLVIPSEYRSWIFLTSSVDLNYNRAVPGATAQPSLLDNVFVNPSAYVAFVGTGKWPDGTVLIKENRIAASAGTISQSGKYQTQVASMELHVKDQKRFPGKWAFFVTDGKQPARYVAPPADCYACHREHAAVDNTFIQFYPTLLPIATAKGTLASGYLKERATLAGPESSR